MHGGKVINSDIPGRRFTGGSLPVKKGTQPMGVCSDLSKDAMKD